MCVLDYKCVYVCACVRRTDREGGYLRVFKCMCGLSEVTYVELSVSGRTREQKRPLNNINCSHLTKQDETGGC